MKKLVPKSPKPRKKEDLAKFKIGPEEKSKIISAVLKGDLKEISTELQTGKYTVTILENALNLIDLNKALVEATKMKPERPDIVQLLLKNNADIHTLDEDGLNLLMVAIKSKNIKIAMIYLEKGIHIQLMDKYGRSLLAYIGEITDEEGIKHKGNVEVLGETEFEDKEEGDYDEFADSDGTGPFHQEEPMPGQERDI